MATAMITGRTRRVHQFGQDGVGRRPLLARINFHGADELVHLRHSDPTTATFVRAGEVDPRHGPAADRLRTGCGPAADRRRGKHSRPPPRNVMEAAVLTGPGTPHSASFPAPCPTAGRRPRRGIRHHGRARRGPSAHRRRRTPAAVRGQDRLGAAERCPARQPRSGPETRRGTLGGGTGS